MGFFAIAMILAPATLVLDARTLDQACPPPPPGEEVVVCTTRGQLATVMPVQIDGKPASFLIEPGGTDSLMCNLDFIVRHRFQGYGPVTVGRVGPVYVEGGYTEVSLSVAQRKKLVDMVWTAKPATASADCSMGPRNLPFETIRFLFGGMNRSAAPTVLPFDVQTGHLYARMQTGRHTLSIRFEHRFARTVLTAPATHAVAPTLGGTAVGPVLMDEIFFGIRRPVRALRLDRPLQIGNLRVASPYVRVSDYGNAAQIQSVDQSELAEDEVVVSARRKPVGPRRLVRIGGDDLDTCASLTVDKRRREFSIVC